MKANYRVASMECTEIWEKHATLIKLLKGLRKGVAKGCMLTSLTRDGRLIEGHPWTWSWCYPRAPLWLRNVTVIAPESDLILTSSRYYLTMNSYTFANFLCWLLLVCFTQQFYNNITNYYKQLISNYREFTIYLTMFLTELQYLEKF